MKELIRYVGIICTVVVIALLTGMYKQPWWFRFVYTFPMIMLLIITTKKKNKVMKQYISKAAVMAEIEARYNECLKRAKIIDAEYWNGKADAYRDMLVTLDTLEAKEVDFDREIRRYRMNNPIIGHREESLYDYMANVAKHFFELGLKAQKGEEI